MLLKLESIIILTAKLGTRLGNFLFIKSWAIFFKQTLTTFPEFLLRH